jgi:DNA-binding response OmpR family regulator
MKESGRGWLTLESDTHFAGSRSKTGTQRRKAVVRAQNILIVEDDPQVMELLQTLLSEEFRINCATTVAEARAFLRSSLVDLVILDSALPDGRGDEIARLAKALGASIIVMCDHAGGPLGGHPCLRKPFYVDTMMGEVRSALEQALTSSRGHW